MEKDNMKHSNLVWWGGEEDNLPWNWGDQLNPWLFSKISGVPYDDIKKFNAREENDLPRYYCIGSILNHIKSEGAEVWGSGFENPYAGMSVKPTKIHAVRGPLTRKGFIWTYPGKEITAKSVICLQNETDTIPKGCYGICSDWVSKYKV